MSKQRLATVFSGDAMNAIEENGRKALPAKGGLHSLDRLSYEERIPGDQAPHALARSRLWVSGESLTVCDSLDGAHSTEALVDFPAGSGTAWLSAPGVRLVPET